MPTIPKNSLSMLKPRALGTLKDVRKMVVFTPSMPNDRFPVVVRRATIGEIANIPGDRYAVKVLASSKGSHNVVFGTGKEEDIVVAISLTKKLESQLKSFRRGYRIQVRNSVGGDNAPSPSNIFNEPVNEDKLADCILGIIDGFFHGEEKCTICNKPYTLMDFCVLVHIFFKYIHILKKDSRLSFGTYLQEKVFAGKSQFGVRTYNNYADKDVYKNFAKKIMDAEVSFQGHPVIPAVADANFLRLAFQEIGWAFQHSAYFGELRKLKETMQTFIL